MKRLAIALSLIAFQTTILFSYQIKEVIYGAVTQSELNGVITFESEECAIITFDHFNIKKEETVKLMQKNEHSRVLIRVMGDERSLIEGTLYSNGIINLVNPHGIDLDKDSRIDASGFYAAAAQISDQDFLNKRSFFSPVCGKIRSQGNIHAEAIHFIGRHIYQLGSLYAQEGIVTLAMGNEALIGAKEGRLFVKVRKDQEEELPTPHLLGEVYSLSLGNTSVIHARHVHIEGDQDTVATISGTIDVSRTQLNEPAGEVWITADQISVEEAKINAFSDVQGGDVFIGGEPMGTGEFPHARELALDPFTSINASGTGYADAGQIILFADDYLSHRCHLFVNGGSLGGNGGLLETSAYKIDREVVKAQLHFQGGKGGNSGFWLVDPPSPALIDTQTAWDAAFNYGGMPVNYCYQVSDPIHPILTIQGNTAEDPIVSPFFPEGQQVVIVQTYATTPAQVAGTISIIDLAINEGGPSTPTQFYQTGTLLLQGNTAETSISGTVENPVYFQAEAVYTEGTASIASDGSNLQ
jgi:filamentous hemagglutinin family protein